MRLEKLCCHGYGHKYMIEAMKQLWSNEARRRLSLWNGKQAASAVSYTGNVVSGVNYCMNATQGWINIDLEKLAVS